MNSGSVYVPTDKINSTIVIQVEDYKMWLSDHLLKATDLVLCSKLIAMFEDANKLIFFSFFFFLSGLRVPMVCS